MVSDRFIKQLTKFLRRAVRRQMPGASRAQREAMVRTRVEAKRKRIEEWKRAGGAIASLLEAATVRSKTGSGGHQHA
jgi:hypothetical protein